MKKRFIPIITSLMLTAIKGSGQNLIWHAQMGGPGNDIIIDLKIDNWGNILTTGFFLGTADFDPGPGTFILNPNNGEVFISKLTAAGNFAWAGQIAGTYSLGQSIQVDGAGNIYVCGDFLNAGDFDPGPGVFTMTPTMWSGFLVKLDSSGTFQWAFMLESALCISSCLDQSGNIYLSGPFSGTVDFDPGPGIYNMTSSYTEGRMFILKLNPNGEFIWAKQLVGSGDPIHYITTDSNNNLLVSGTFSDTTDIDPGTGVYNLIPGTIGANEVFILKLDTNGDFVWAKQIGGISLQSIAADVNGNVYTTGLFIGPADYDPGPGVFNLTHLGFTADMFISKLDSNGNFVFALQIGDTIFPPQCNSIIIDASGNLLLTGKFRGTVDFNPGTGVFNLNSPNHYNAFILKLNDAGSFISATHFAGSNQDLGKALATDNNGNIVVTGRFSGTTDFDPGPAVSLLTSFGSNDIFVVKLDNLTGIEENYIEGLNLIISPNPGNGMFTLHISSALLSDGPVYLNVYDMTGRLVWQEGIKHVVSNINLQSMPDGIYLFRVANKNKLHSKKVVKFVVE